MPLEPELLELENELRKLAPLELDFPNGQRVMGALAEEITAYADPAARPAAENGILSPETWRVLGGYGHHASAAREPQRSWSIGIMGAAAALLVVGVLAWQPLDSTRVRQALAKLTAPVNDPMAEGEAVTHLGDSAETSPSRRARIAPIYPSMEEAGSPRSHFIEGPAGSSYEANTGGVPRQPMRFARVPEATSQYGFLDVRQAFALPPDYCKNKGIEGGVVLSELGVHGPAALQGLESGDIVLSIDGKPIRTTEEFCHTIRSTPPGTTVKMKIRRDHIFMEILIRLASAPSA